MMIATSRGVGSESARGSWTRVCKGAAAQCVWEHHGATCCGLLIFGKQRVGVVQRTHNFVPMICRPGVVKCRLFTRWCELLAGYYCLHFHKKNSPIPSPLPLMSFLRSHVTEFHVMSRCPMADLVWEWLGPEGEWAIHSTECPLECANEQSRPGQSVNWPRSVQSANLRHSKRSSICIGTIRYFGNCPIPPNIHPKPRGDQLIWKNMENVLAYLF
jgi:hypothetical protein